MKSLPAILATAAISVWCGCSSTPLAVAPVGPNPDGLNRHTADGQLEVYSALVGRSEGNNPAWFQHANYTIYDQNGHRVRQIRNVVGRYAERPSSVALPPGRYLVKTEAQDFFQVKVPVVIEAGRTTRVHLDNRWRPAAAPSARMVMLPGNHPVGWSASAE